MDLQDFTFNNLKFSPLRVPFKISILKFLNIITKRLTSFAPPLAAVSEKKLSLVNESGKME